MKLSLRALCLLLTCAMILPLAACGTSEPLAGEEDGRLCLASNGKSSYRVVIAAAAEPDIVTIAEELVGYLEKITGVTLPIVRDSTPAQEREIVIGKTSREIDSSIRYENLDEEGLVYYTEGRCLLLTGGSTRGVAYAVYGFLEDHCGVRYYSPTYEKIPTTETLLIPDDLAFTDEPVFWFRSMNQAGDDDPIWMVKMRQNARLSLGSENYRRDPFVGGGIGYADWYVHTLGKLAEMEKTTGKTVFTNLQPCLSDETVYQTVLKNVRLWLELYPDADIISISQNDGTYEKAMCTCPDCSATYKAHGNVQSALFVKFVSRIANELADEYPDVYFDTLAYNFTLLAPTGLEIPDNMIIRMAPAHACINHPHNECADGGALGPQRASDKFIGALADWSEIADQLFVWDYDTLFYNYWAPYVAYDPIRENILNYAEHGMDGVYIQGDSTGSNGFAEMRAYLVAKLLWDPYMTEEEYRELMRDFMEGYYGPGSSEGLLGYIDFLNDQNEYTHFSLYGYMIRDFLPIDVYVDDDGVAHFDRAALVDPMNAFFDAAEAGVTDETQLLHLRKARTQVKFYELMSLYWLVDFAEGRPVENEVERRRELNEELYADVIACQMPHISEGFPIPSEPNLNYAPFYWNR